VVESDESARRLGRLVRLAADAAGLPLTHFSVQALSSEKQRQSFERQVH
jgi:hypothetical protein